MNTTNLIQIDGGEIVKQGDLASPFAFILADEHGEPIEVGNSAKFLELENRIKGLEVATPGAQTVRPPFFYYLDTYSSTSTWSAIFDNGCVLSGPSNLPGLWGTTSTRSYYGASFTPNGAGPSQVIAFAQGLPYTSARNKTAGTWTGSLWSKDLTVLNPIRPADAFDWSGAFFDSTATAQVKQIQSKLISILWQLGLWDEAVFVSLGAVKK